MAETVHKGWLETRDGEKFAPMTLIENVNTRSGKPYDQHVREYITSLNSKLNNKVNTVQVKNDQQDKSIEELQKKDTELSKNITNLDTKLSKDIADLGTKNSEQDIRITELQAKDTEFTNKLQHFDGSTSDTLYIIDNNNKIVAYINKNGIHATEYTNANGATFSDIVNRLKTCEDELTWIDTMANNEAFYFIDNGNNVAAKIDGTGITAVDFTAKGQSYTLVGLNTEVKNNAGHINVLTDRANILENNLKTYYGYEHLGQDTFYFIDNNNNVVAKIDSAGITTTNITFANEKNAKQNMMFFENMGTINISY